MAHCGRWVFLAENPLRPVGLALDPLPEMGGRIGKLVAHRPVSEPDPQSDSRLAEYDFTLIITVSRRAASLAAASSSSSPPLNLMNLPVPTRGFHAVPHEACQPSANVLNRQKRRLCEEIDERVKTFLSRPIEGLWPYVWIDATYVKVREGGRIISVRWCWLRRRPCRWRFRRRSHWRGGHAAGHRSRTVGMGRIGGGHGFHGHHRHRHHIRFFGFNGDYGCWWSPRYRRWVCPYY
jgi:mutator family transposase